MGTFTSFQTESRHITMNSTTQKLNSRNNVIKIEHLMENFEIF